MTVTQDMVYSNKEKEAGLYVREIANMASDTHFIRYLDQWEGRMPSS